METTTAEVMDPKKAELQKEVLATGLIQVVDAESYKAAGERWKALVALEKKIHEEFDPSVDTATDALNAARALRAKFLDPVVAAKKEQPVLMKAWERREECKRQAEERRLQEEAKKKADDDALAEAKSLEDQGFKEAAKEIIETPVVAPHVVAPRVVPKGFGGATQRRWKARVVDLPALIKAVAAGTVPSAVLQANDSVLGAQARALKAEMRYPGVETWEE